MTFNFLQSYNPNYYTFLAIAFLGEIRLSDDKCTYFVKVAVAPHLPIHKRTRQDATLGIKLCPLTHASPLQPNKLSGGRIGHIDYCQAAAGQPHSRAALSIIHDAKGELAVIIVNLLCACVAVEVNGEKIATMSLEKTGNGRREVK